ncbi:helix-turn-helix transcriptional regulator [Hyphobacterium sp.]|uniref:helix-turn-helix transcriptional regulator n=1 Tax=Hyphobacterium sp. TaxID=2004662 RepID=UPI003BAC361D
MSRARRLVEIVRALKQAAPGSLTAQHIAERFSVSERTIYRDMAKLIDSGIPIEGEAGLGYMLAPDEGPPPVSMTWRQAQLLWRGARLMALTADEDAALDANAVQSRLEKVLGEQRLARTRSQALLSLTDNLRPVPAIMDALKRALDQDNNIRIRYVELDESDGEYIGRPMAITPVGDIFILTLSTPDGLVHLRIERIRKLTLRS